MKRLFLILALLLSALPLRAATVVDAVENYACQNEDDCWNGGASGVWFGKLYRSAGITHNAPFINPILAKDWSKFSLTSCVGYVDPFVNGKYPGGAQAFSNTLSLQLQASDKYALLYHDNYTFSLPQNQKDPFYGYASLGPNWINAVNDARKANPTVKLIDWGSHLYSTIQPSPQWIANNVTQVRSMPFDGIGVMIKGLNEDGQDVGSVHYRLLSSQPFTYQQIAAQLKPLIGLNLGNVKTNLATLQTVALAGDVKHGLSKCDFADDAAWSGITNSAANCARAVREAGLSGFLIDVEDYNYAGTWSYEKVSHPELGLGQYQDLAKRRGRQIMAAILTEFPDAIVVCAGITPAQSVPGNPYYNNAVNQLELYGPWYAGLVEMASGRF